MASCASRRWAILVATVWVQAFTGTNFDFSAYSSKLKAAMGISQVQLSYLATASDLGKALGWSSGLALLYLPLPAVLLLAAAFGAAAYASQWLLVTSRISLPYLPVFLLCLLAGCSICWFNTVCFVLCIKNFPASRSLALSLTISFNGVSAALFTLVANAIDGGSSSSLYLLLNAILPLVASAAALIPILRQPSTPSTPLSTEASCRDSQAFLFLNILAFLTGLYLLFLSSVSSIVSTARWLLAGAIILLLLPLCMPRIVFASDGSHGMVFPCFHFGSNGPERRKEFIESHYSKINNDDDEYDNGGRGGERNMMSSRWWCWCCYKAMEKDRLEVLGEEHGAKRLVRRIDFWLYYISYFCGATVGLVYSNNLGQIAQSLGKGSQTTMLVTVYSSCSFFGRLLSSIPDLLHRKMNFARTGWLAIALVPMPLAFFLLAEASDGHALLVSTALVGLSSGFIFAAAVSVTSELFGPRSMGVNHNILITNIPIGSLLYGLLAALFYDAHGSSNFLKALLGDGMVMCMGRKCYAETFVAWGCISFIGLASSTALFLRTKPAYDRPERGLAAAQLNEGDFR